MTAIDVGDGAAATPSSQKRGTVACRRCRRLRSKCIHDGAQPPCASCSRAGGSIATDCYFPPRGHKDLDRGFRAKRVRAPDADSDGRGASHGVEDVGLDASLRDSEAVEPRRRQSEGYGVRKHVSLPPRDEIIEGCRMVTTSYFQLGFIPKALFLEELSKDNHIIPPFLISCILAISARFTPALVQRYGSTAAATSYFLDMASALVVDEMYEPTLHRTQAFFLLSVAQWGHGDKNRSIIHMGIAVRMAAILGLHREETYKLPPRASRDQVVAAEAARRTFWMIQSQDNLHSGHRTPVSFSPADITALLPGDENDFAFGREPLYRAALPDTPPALDNPGRISAPNRSLFATLIQTHHLWGIVARRACKGDEGPFTVTGSPAESNSEYRGLAEKLRLWEQELPPNHRWSVWNLRGYTSENLELAYLAIVMVIRLSNIVLRRAYLPDMVAAAQSGFDPAVVEDGEFWRSTSHELFANVLELHEQIDAYFPKRLKVDGFPALLAFCVYACGSAAACLWKWPELCPALANEAEAMAKQALQVLSDLQHAWPTAARWRRGLQHVTTPVANGSALIREGIASHPASPAIRQYTASTSVAGDTSAAHGLQAVCISSEESSREPLPGEDDHVAQALGSSVEQDHPTEPVGAFEAELAALLQGDLDNGFYGDWGTPLA